MQSIKLIDSNVGPSLNLIGPSTVNQKPKSQFLRGSDLNTQNLILSDTYDANNSSTSEKMKVKVRFNDTELNSYKVMQHLNDIYGNSKNNPESPENL